MRRCDDHCASPTPHTSLPSRRSRFAQARGDLIRPTERGHPFMAENREIDGAGAILLGVAIRPTDAAGMATMYAFTIPFEPSSNR